MRNIIKPLIPCAYIGIVFFLSQFFGCASIQHPTGGPRDSVAPKILKESPKNFTTSFKEDRINIEFNEYFKLTNEFKEISVSPAMEKAPVFKVKKKILNIQFQEPLQDSTTYTINFGNAIADYNEGNVLKNYMYVFATGNKIDSLSITGNVKNTLTKEGVLDATVFILPTSQDSLFGKKRASIFTTTDSSGNFSLKYLREGRYNLYALNEKGGDKIYNSTNEEVGFLSAPIVLTKDTTGIELELFKEQPKDFRLVDRKIEKDARISFFFNKQLEKPGIQILQPEALNSTKITEFSSTNDTAYVWTQSMEFDSIAVAIQDNKKNIDTVIIRRNKRDSYTRDLTITDNISAGRLRPGTDVAVLASAPISLIDGKKITLLQDSVPVNGLRVSRDSLSTRRIIFKYPWRDEKQYIISIAEGGLTGTFGGTNKPYSKQFVKDSEDNYGVLSIILTVPDTSKTYLLQVLNPEDNIIKSDIIRKNTTLTYPMMSIGKYYVRIIYDENKNGKWDTGNIKEKKQPEKVWNYQEEISLRANFDIEQKITVPKDE